MNRKTRLYAAVALVALFVAGVTGSCSKIKPITAPAAGGGNASFSLYVAMGTSIGAGYESDGLVYRHQLHAYPALFARQVGSAFTYPAISDSGITFTAQGPKALLQLVSLIGPVIVRGTHPGEPTNFDQANPYTNMSVPGALLANAADSTLYPLNPFFAQVVQRGRGTILQQIVSLNPTFVSFEYGANEVLGPATEGSGTPRVDAPTFGFLLRATLDALQAQLPNAKLAIFNVPDVTTIPFVTTIKPYLVNPQDGSHIPLIGPDGPLSESDFVLLPAGALLAAGTGVPIPAGGNGNPLPDAVVLSATEANNLKLTMAAYNDSIQTQAAARGMALVDLHELLMTASTRGIRIGAVTYSSAFLTGGLFSLDGVHPTDLGHGLIANIMIDAVNAQFGASVPHVNLSDAASNSASRLQPSREEGGPSWPQVEGLDNVIRVLNAGRR